MKRLLAVGCLLAFAAAAHAQNWPQFRGPKASGVAEGHATPTKWNAETGANLLWKTKLPGLAHSSPIVWGGRIFVTTAISSDPNPEFREGRINKGGTAKDDVEHTWRLYSLDKQTGEILWERTAHQGVPKSRRHPTSTLATPTPVTNGEVVVAYFGSEGMYAYDFDGNLLWKRDLGILNVGNVIDPDDEWGVASSPIIYQDLVIVQCDSQEESFIAAFRLQDGKQVWRTPRDEYSSWGTPMVYEGKDGAELVTHAKNFIRGYNPMTGKELWRLSGNSNTTAPTPIAAHDLIFVASGFSKLQPIYAIRPGARGDISLPEGRYASEYIAWSLKRGGPDLPTPIIYGDYLYTCKSNGVLTAYNARTGERIYRVRLAGKGGAYSASPVAADGKIYFSSEDGEIIVIKAGPKYELLAENPMGEVMMATPAISDGVIYIRGLKNLFAVAKTPSSD